MIAYTARLLTYFLAAMMCMTAIWVKVKFGDFEFERLVYHIQFGIDGQLIGDPVLKTSFIKYCLVWPFIFSMGMVVCEISLRKIYAVGARVLLKEIFGQFKNGIFVSLDFISKAANNWIFRHAPIFLLVISFLIFLEAISVHQYLFDQQKKEKDFFAQFYASPQKMKTPKSPKNLVLIYVESLEQTYSNSNIFGVDLLQDLNNETTDALRFENYQSIGGADWTIAAMVASQCGVPLKSVSLFPRQFQPLQVENFLHKAICLGDILKDHGYQNIFMGGAPLSYAGRKNFLSSHGYDELYGKEEWKKLGESNFNEWGLYDDRLFFRAKERLLRLEKERKPFNLTLLTVDTHFPSGFLSDTCLRYGATEITGIIQCTSMQLANFIKFMRMNNYIENTNVVIVADHLTMPNNLLGSLEKEPNRTLFNAIISQEKFSPNRKKLNHFSLFPTILHSLGFEFDENRLGLGSSGIGTLSNDYNLDQFDNIELENFFKLPSEKYYSLWVD